MSTIIKYYQAAEAERKTAGQTAMVKLAELSGGFTSFLENPEDAENIYSDIFTVMKNRYVIGYYPTNRTRDGEPDRSQFRCAIILNLQLPDERPTSFSSPKKGRVCLSRTGLGLNDDIKRS